MMALVIFGALVLIAAAFLIGTISGENSRDEEVAELIKTRQDWYERWQKECAHADGINAERASALAELQALRDAIRQKADKAKRPTGGTRAAR